MKWSFVWCLNLLPLSGHQQFIWAEKPTGPLGILQLLACVKQVGRWSGSDLLDVLSHKVSWFVGEKTVQQKDLFHRLPKLFCGTWSALLNTQPSCKDGDKFCKAVSELSCLISVSVCVVFRTHATVSVEELQIKQRLYIQTSLKYSGGEY